MSDADTLTDEELTELRRHATRVAAEFACTATVRVTHRQGSGVQTEGAHVEVTIIRQRQNGPPLHKGTAVSVASCKLRGAEVFDTFIRAEAGPQLKNAQ